jgi:hypothetical protein
VALHLAYRWFCKLDLDNNVPHHSTFSVNRLGRFRESGILRHVFERVVAACMAAGLVKGEGFAVDASVMEANGSRYHSKAPDELDWIDAQRQKRAVAEYLAGLEAETCDQEGKDSRDGGSDGRRTANPDRKPPKVISPPDSAWTAKANKALCHRRIRRKKFPQLILITTILTFVCWRLDFASNETRGRSGLVVTEASPPARGLAGRPCGVLGLGRPRIPRTRRRFVKRSRGRTCAPTSCRIRSMSAAWR